MSSDLLSFIHCDEIKPWEFFDCFSPFTDKTTPRNDYRGDKNNENVITIYSRRNIYNVE